MKLVEGLEHKGHHLYCENFYSSPDLFVDLRPIERRSRFAEGGCEVIFKPQCIVEYNRHMGGMDLSDQMIRYYSFSHRSVKWWKHVFFHLIDTTIFNAYILYNQSTQSSRKLTRELSN